MLYNRPRQFLHFIRIALNIHNRHTRHLPDPLLQLRVTRRHHVAPVNTHPPHDAVVRVRPLVVAREPLAYLLDQPQRDCVDAAELLQLGDYAVGDEQLHACAQAPRHFILQVDLPLDAEVYKVRVDDYRERGDEVVVDGEVLVELWGDVWGL